MTEDEQDPIAVGAELRRRREAAGQTQEAVAKELGTTQQTIDRIERGETRHSRFLLPLKLLWDREDALGEAYEAQLNKRLAPAAPPEIPVYDWKKGRIAEGTLHRLPAPARFRDPLTGYRDGYGVQLLSPVFSPSGDMIFHVGDVLFVLPEEPLRHGRWSLLIGQDDPRDVSIGMLGDPDAMPPQITRQQLVEWGYSVPTEQQLVHPVVGFHAG